MDACEALLVVWKEDDGLPCYPLMEQYSTDVLGAMPEARVGERFGVMTGGAWREAETSEQGSNGSMRSPHRCFTRLPYPAPSHHRFHGGDPDADPCPHRHRNH